MLDLKLLCARKQAEKTLTRLTLFGKHTKSSSQNLNHHSRDFLIIDSQTFIRKTFLGVGLYASQTAHV